MLGDLSVCSIHCMWQTNKEHNNNSYLALYIIWPEKNLKFFDAAVCVVSLNTCHSLQHILSLHKLSCFQPDEDGTLSCLWKRIC